MTDCPWTERVSLLWDGELPTADVEAVREHLGGCGDCGEFWAVCAIIEGHRKPRSWWRRVLNRLRRAVPR